MSTNQQSVHLKFKEVIGTKIDHELEIYVLPKLLEDYPDFKEKSLSDVMIIPYSEYLHNDKGWARNYNGTFAGISSKGPIISYHLNGIYISDEEEIRKINHNGVFTPAVEEFLKEE